MDFRNSIVANAVLDMEMEDKITLKAVYLLTRDELANYFDTDLKIINFIKYKLRSMCQIGLITDTGLGYYRF